MKHAGNGIYNKVDVIMHGMETIGSAERATDTYEMREQFHNISDGQYANLLYNHFGKKRVEDELDLHTPPQLSPVQSVASAQGSDIPNLDDSDLEFDEPIPDSSDLSLEEGEIQELPESPDLSLEEGEIAELASNLNIDSARRLGDLIGRLDFEDPEEID